MRSLFVVILEPCSQRLSGFVQRVEVMKPETLLFDSPDQPFNHVVLLRSVGLDKLLLETVVIDRPGVMSGSEHQTITHPPNVKPALPSPRHPLLPSRS